MSPEYTSDSFNPWVQRELSPLWLAERYILMSFSKWQNICEETSHSRVAQ